MLLIRLRHHQRWRGLEAIRRKWSRSFGENIPLGYLPNPWFRCVNRQHHSVAQWHPEQHVHLILLRLTAAVEYANFDIAMLDRPDHQSFDVHALSAILFTNRHPFPRRPLSQVQPHGLGVGAG